MIQFLYKRKKTFTPITNTVYKGKKFILERKNPNSDKQVLQISFHMWVIEIKGKQKTIE